ncbi:unnamed protein product [Phytomonas sp. EM1]|nr:unnamed protein product [Phytomonas sp. EM1]|eukprot:CCW65012.1 unnamed protein product [Phytomonas sp. isolate EM1]
MLGRDELPHPLPLTVNLIYDVDDAAVAKHVPCAHLAAHGICHRKGRVGARNPSTATSERNDSPPPPPSPSEVGGIPSLRWVKPRTSRSARFGASRGGSARRELPTLQEAPLRVLEPSFALVEPRVRGNPMIGSTISREKRERRFAGAHAESESETAGVGGVGGGAGGPLGVHSPSRFGSYRPSVTPAGQRGSHAPAVDDMFSLITPKVKSIPQFDKQVPRESPVISHNRLL